MDILSFITSLSIPYLGFNWLDIIVVIIVIFYAFEGYSLGFVMASIDFISFVLSFIFGLTFYNRVASVLVQYLSASQGFANAIGFFVVAAFFEIILSVTLKSLSTSAPFFSKDFQNETLKSVNRVLGIVPGALSGIVLSTFILSLIIALPFSVFLKHSVTDSKIGSVLVANTQGFSRSWNNVFGGAVNDTLSFLTVEPQSNQTVKLNFTVQDTTIDKTAEQEMFTMVNSQRTSRGLSALSWSEPLARVGRMHCMDMFNRGYFSHYTPEGLSPFDRMLAASITFNYAGENLALAPNVTLAMNGLMQSPGHRANILSVHFSKVGIGVIDGGIYGEMFCQEFTD